MQLAAVSSFLLASKLEEAGPGPGAARVQRTAPWPPFDPDTLARMEPTLLDALGWKTTALTPSNFLDRLMLHVGLGLGPGPAGALALAVRERAQSFMAAAITGGQAAGGRRRRLLPAGSLGRGAPCPALSCANLSAACCSLALAQRGACWSAGPPASRRPAWCSQRGRRPPRTWLPPQRPACVRCAPK